MRISPSLSLLIGVLSLFALSSSVAAQTLTLSDDQVIQSKTSRIGINIGAINYWDNGQVLKNLIGSTNPGFEPLLDQQIWAVNATGTTTSFTIPDVYDTVAANYWTGATFQIIQSQSNGSEAGCTGTVVSNTGPNNPSANVTTWVAPVITTTACSSAFAIGDVVVIKKSFSPTPETWWESNGNGGMSGSVSGGGTLTSDTTDLCSSCGTQALTLNSSATDSDASATWNFDSLSVDNAFVLMNGNYEFTFWAKAVSGTPQVTLSASRLSSNGFNCGTQTMTLTTSWAQYSWTCSASETAQVVPATVKVSFDVTGGTVYLDNVAFQKTNTDSTNTTAFRDEVIQTLQTFYGGTTQDGSAGTFRYWVNQNGETMANWTAPSYERAPTASGTGYYVGPGGSGVLTLSLYDYLALCKFLHVDPYLEVPVTLSAADAANLIDFLGGSTSTTYGARRETLGQSDPWTTVFGKIHLSFCNECWNGVSFVGQSLADRTNAPNQEYYYDYSVRAATIFAAMRASSSYSSTAFDLVMNAQTAVNYTMDTAINRAHPDSIELEAYMYGAVSSFSTDKALWQPAMVDPYQRIVNSSDGNNFYQSVHDYQALTTCGAKGTSACAVNIYEWGQGTISGSIDQTHLDYINAGAGQGVIAALQPLLNLQNYGIGPQNYFSLSEYKNGASNGLTSKLWGSVIDMGGATNNVRPEFLGISLVNQSIIGPMFSCPITSNLTYNFAGSSNGVAAIPAISNVPYLYAFCFESGTQRSIVLINTDLTTSHSIAFGGTNKPTGSVTVRQYAPSGLNLMNEAPTGTVTSQVAATVANTSSSLSTPTSVSLPPYSVTALDYITTGATQTSATPTFSPAAGTYSTAQTVTISSTTSDAVIHYTTDGSTPTASSATYGRALSVNSTETINAIAVTPGYTDSAVASATYTISSVLPAPTFSLATGTYSTTQTVTLSDATSSAVIHYTTDGSTPTASSATYSGALSVSQTETINAIAVASGYTNSDVASATYTISSVLPAPTFSPAAGTYSTTQTVTLSDSTSGAVIHYTTDGTTPTASSAVYASALSVSTSETVKAIAIKTGYTNSAVASAAYIIGSTITGPVFSPSPGLYYSSQSVSITHTNADAAIYYTTDGSTPTTSSTRYSGPIWQSATQTFNAIAVVKASGSTSTSATTTASYTIAPVLPTPSFTLVNGLTYQTAQTTTILDSESGVSIYYTTDGSTPTAKSTPYSGAITVSKSETIQAIAVKTGYTNSAVASISYAVAGSVLPAPVFSLAAGTYSATQTVTLADATSGVSIYYTTDGNTPTTSSTRYGSALTVSETETVKAIAVKTGYTNSGVSTAMYIISNGTLPAPAFSLAAGTYSTTQTLTLTDATSGAAIHYTTDGSTPTASSAKYGSALTVSATETVRAIAVKTGYTNSSVASATYIIGSAPQAPGFSPTPGLYYSPQTVYITDADPDAAIYYTTDGSTPTTSSTRFSGPIWQDKTQTLHAIAVVKVSGSTSTSAMSTGAYTIAPVLPTPFFGLVNGLTYLSAQTTTITDRESGVSIYYTTDGSTPTTKSTLYTGAIAVSKSETIQAIAVKTGYTDSEVASITYRVATSSH